MKPQVPWLRIFVEGMVIVGSILLAFGIDAWWEEKQDSAEQVQILESLATEFALNRSILDAAIARHDSIAHAALQLAAIGYGETPPPDEKLLQITQMALFRVQTTNVSSGSLTALLSSGSMGLVRDPVVRSRLAAWPSVVEEALEDERAAVEYQRGFITPFTIEYLPGMWIRQTSGNVIPEARLSLPSELREALGADAVRGRLSFHGFIHGVARDELSRLRGDLEQLMELVEGRLSELKS